MTVDYERLLGALSSQRVEFVIVGGLAATIHGSARLTTDLDVAYSRSAANLRRLVDALSPLRPYLREAPPGLPFELDVETLRHGLNFTLTTDAGPLDLLGELSGVGAYSQVAKHAVSVKLFGLNCKCLDLQTLIASKRAAGRIKDMEAIAELEALRDELQR